jgi:hypothetical protein
MYICECGEELEHIESEEAAVHVLESHLDVVESIFQDFVEEAEFDLTEDDVDELYEDAVTATIEDLLDEIVEE